MSKTTVDGNIYFDTFYGNDTTGAGTVTNKYRTAGRAYTAATNGQTIVGTGVITGTFTGAKGVNIVADGELVCDGSGLADGTNYFPTGTLASLTGVKARFFQGNSVLFTTTASPVALIDCMIEFCRLASSPNSAANARFSITRCVIQETTFVSASTGTNMGSFRNSTFVNCGGGFMPLNIVPTVFNIDDNIFHLCENLLTNLPASRPGNSSFNYNNISGKLNNRSTAEWQTFSSGSYQANGYSVAASDVFVDYVVGRSVSDYWMQNFAMKDTSILKDASSVGLHIGAIGAAALVLSADAIWNTYRTSSTNITYSPSRGLILLDVGVGFGTLETGWIPIVRNIQFNRTLLNAFFVRNTGGDLLQYPDQNDNVPISAGVNQRFSLDFDVAVSNTNSGTPVWKKQEYNRLMRLDANGNGVADDSYNQNSTIQIPSGSYIALRIGLRNKSI